MKMLQAIKKNKVFKYISIIILFGIIIVLSFILFFYWTEMWQEVKVLTYYNGCKEYYKDDVLVKGDCSIERKYVEDHKRQQQWWLNLNLSNTTLI